MQNSITKTSRYILLTIIFSSLIMILFTNNIFAKDNTEKEKVTSSRDESEDSFDEVFRQIKALQNMINFISKSDNYMFEDFFGKKHKMNTDISTYDKKYVVNIDFPGFEKDELLLEKQGDYLVIKGKKAKVTENNQDETDHYREKYRSSFQHTVLIPKDVDSTGISSKLKNGILTIILPRVEKKPEDTVVIKID